VSYDHTDDWQKLLDGRKYNNTLEPPYNDMVNLNIDFINDQQWKNVENNGIPTPVFNIMKRAETFFVASITSSKTAIKLEPLEYAEEEEQQTPEMQDQQHASDIATGEIENLFEKFKMDNMIRDALFKASRMGDVYFHGYFDMKKKPYGGMFGNVEGEICGELVNGTNVFLGNPNNPIIDKYTQPYLQVTGRNMVKRLQIEAQQYKNSQEADKITSDSNWQYEAGEMAKVEILSDNGKSSGKALYVITYTYHDETDTIWASKCTEGAYMYKDIDTGLSDYPVAGLCWEKQENQYHGRALCSGIIPNQIYINRQFAMVMYHLMNAAFPKLIYNADRLPEPTNRVASAIGVRGVTPGESIMNYVGQLNPGVMSGEIIKVIDMAIAYTKEMLGINDAALGNINPEQASGTAIASTVRQAAIPLENTRANLYGWLEDIARIMIDMMGTNYGTRPIIIKSKGIRQKVDFDFSTLKHLWLNIKCDVGPSSYYSEIAQVQMMDTLLSMKDPLFTMIDYLENLPENYKNEDLIERVKENLQKQIQQQEQQMAQQGQMQTQQDQQGQDQQMQQDQQIQDQQLQQQDDQSKEADFYDSLPPQTQQQIKQLPAESQQKALMQLMQSGIKKTMQNSE